MKTYYQSTSYTHPLFNGEQVDIGTVRAADDVTLHQICKKVTESFHDFFVQLYPGVPTNELKITTVRVLDTELLHELIDGAEKTNPDRIHIHIENEIQPEK